MGNPSQPLDMPKLRMKKRHATTLTSSQHTYKSQFERSNHHVYLAKDRKLENKIEQTETGRKIASN
jgi:hypothetical protein